MKALKTIHIAFLSIMGGGFSVILYVLLSKADSTNPDKLAYFDSVVVYSFTGIITYASFVLLLTSFMYSLFTHWRFLVHRWILLKWIGIIAIFSMTWFWGGPAYGGMAALSSGYNTVGANAATYAAYTHQSILFTSITLGLFILLLLTSVTKPFGKTNLKLSPAAPGVKIVVMLLVVSGIGFQVWNEINYVSYRRKQFDEVNLSLVKDGYYEGESVFGKSTYKVGVDLRNGQIAKIDVLQNRDTKYAIWAEGVLNRIVREQRINVDAVTGATSRLLHSNFWLNESKQ